MVTATAPLLKVPAAYGRALVNRFGAKPPARAALLAASGLSEAELAAPSGEIDLKALLGIAAAIAHTDGEDWPLRAPEVWSNAMQGALEVAARSAPTVGDAMAILARYGPIRAPYIGIKLSRTRTGVKLTIDLAADVDDATWRSIAYSIALSVHAMLAQMCSGALEGARVAFPWPAPPFAPELTTRISCAVIFGASYFAIEAPAALCARSSPFADPALQARAIAELEQALARAHEADAAIVHTTARLIAARLPARMSEDEAATQLAMSRRSLVRRLHAAGASYRDILDETLRARAAAMLARKDMTRSDMAAALGYADPTSFSRACRRWFGKPTP